VSLKDFSKDFVIFRDFLLPFHKKENKNKRTLEVEKHLIKHLVEVL